VLKPVWSPGVPHTMDQYTACACTLHDRHIQLTCIPTETTPAAQPPLLLHHCRVV
jgi:hypothetical protein